MMDDFAIELKSISKSYVLNDAKIGSVFNKDKRNTVTNVLDNINLTVKKGEIVALVGRNGCGKTTLMKIIAGMIDQTSGTVRLNGKMICIIESGSLFINDETGYNNIIYRGMLYGMSKAEVLSKMESIVRYAELGDAVNKPVRTYSLGMKSRLGFSIMAYVDADIFILDEALNAGDSIFSGKAMKFLNKLSLAGKTVIMTSHSGNILREVSTRAVLIENGRIIADAQYPEINARYRRTLMSSIKTIEEAAESDNPSVQYTLAKIKQESDPEEYEMLLRNSAEGCNVAAMIEYGDLLFDKGQRDEAIAYYYKAAKAGDDDGRIRYAMARLIHSMPSVTPLISSYAENGDHFDKYRYGIAAKNMAVGTSMRTRAYGFLKEAYEKGNPDAGYEVALMKIIGNGTYLDIDGAINILADNAMKGHMRSAKKLYELYSDGRYIDPDPLSAFKWCKKAAKMGDTGSQFALSMMYANGVGTEKDEAKMDEWLGIYLRSLAAPTMTDMTYNMNNSGIECELDENFIYSMLKLGYNEKAVARYFEHWFLNRKSGDSKELFDECTKYCNNGKNLGALAKCYLEGIYVENDDKEAFRLYSIAANAGDPDSMYILANMYKYGIGTEKDNEQYKRWTRLAARFNQLNASMIVRREDAIIEQKVKRIAKMAKLKEK